MIYIFPGRGTFKISKYNYLMGLISQKFYEIEEKILFNEDLWKQIIVDNQYCKYINIFFNYIKQKSEMNSEILRKHQNLINSQIEEMTESDILSQKSQGQIQSTFQATWQETMIKIVKVLQRAKTKINDVHYIQKMQKKMQLLKSQKKYLVEEGLIYLYVDIYDEKKIAKKQGNKQMSSICFHLLRSLEDLIKYFFLEHELRQFRKYRSTFLQNFSQNFEDQDQAMEKKIRIRVSNQKCSNLFKNYLKDQQANKNKELCRICYKKIEISELGKHVDFCGKKTYIKEQLLQNFSKRMEIIVKLQKLLNELIKQNKDAKVVEKILKIVHFYQNISNYKKNKRTSMRYYDKNCPLFFYEHESFGRNHNEVKLINQLSFFEDRAFCLNKKLELIENQFHNQKGGNNDTLKYSLNSNFKKYEKEFIQLSQNPRSDKNQEKRKRNKYNSNIKETLNKISQIKQEDIQTEQPIIVQKKLKRRSNCERYSISVKSDSNASQTDYCSISINDFSILNLLGKGAFGKVYLVRRNKTKDFYALKVIKIDKNWGENQLQFIKNEYGIYKKIAGDHLVTATFSFQQKNAQFFVLQYMPGGDLARVLQQNIYLDEPVAKFYLAQILLAIEHLHNSEIVHRDLKPENIVLDSKGHIKLTDFGLSQIRVRNKLRRARDSLIEQKQQVGEIFLTNKKSMIKNKNGKKLIGTPDYIAPQIIEGVSLVNPTIDWWSFGVIAYQMLIGCRPFSANTVEQIIANIEKGEIQLPQVGQQQNMLSPVAADFVKKLLTKNFQQRLGFNGVQQIKHHDFFKGLDWNNLKKVKPPLINHLQKDGKNQNIEFLAQKNELRKQIQIMMDSQMENKLQQLRNYVRYDLLRAETLESVELRVIKKESRLRKLKSIACNFAKNEPNQIKYKPAMSSEDENDE